jgi:signal transduction histidine kinase
MSDERTLESLAAEVESLRQEIGRLNVELEETNRGVLALYAELDDRAAELRRASEYKSRFLSVMSHELRTPLTSVLNLSRLLLDRVDGDLTHDQERQITLIRNSVQSLTEMVNELLDLAKIEAGKTTLRLTRSPVVDLVTGLRGVFRPVVQNNSVALVFDDPDPSLELCTDEGKLAQVLRNFIANAVKFTERGEIRLTVTSDGNDRITFAVSDTGIGIDPADQSLIFEEFAQVDNPRQRYVKGTGLGLSLSKRIAELLHGEIGLRSALGQGSTFWITLPRVHPLAQPDCDQTVLENVTMPGAPHG